MSPVLLEQRKQPVSGVAAIKQRQAVSGQMREVQMGAIALADCGWWMARSGCVASGRRRRRRAWTDGQRETRYGSRKSAS